ncbi:hypothetical protein F0562_012481 [Nyssa sinensis]|uniref:Glycosyltransferases n=1 Tax=Nyssa sinensis TaxID=561372 RepID=A0A5J4ZW04_9ASTE|nr:hypothetical protein F0562_012481 [Nyssa sinensis]
MASIRRTLSPVPRPGTFLNGEACSVASPLSKSSSCAPNYPPSGGYLSSSFGSLDYLLYRLQAFVLGLFSQRSSRPLERPKSKGQPWRRALFHFFICFMIGVFIGLTPFVSMNSSTTLMSKHQAFSFEVIPPVGKVQLYDVMPINVTQLVDSLGMNDNATLEPHRMKLELRNMESNDTLVPQSINQDSDMIVHKLLIIVTPTYSRPFQAYYLNRLAHTLKLVSPPLLWIVVDMAPQSAETADILRRTGVMYRHLVCDKNSTDIKDRAVHQSNVALSHIETHRLDGIVYFADDDNIYSTDLFEHMRQIRRFGTWADGQIIGGQKQTYP